MEVHNNDESVCSNGLPFLYYLTVANPERTLFSVLSSISGALYLFSFLYISAAINRRICTYEHEFPELCTFGEQSHPLNVYGIGGCFGVVFCGWPGPSLRGALLFSSVSGFAAGIAIICQAALNAQDYYMIHRSFELVFVVAAAINMYMTVRIQITLNIVPEQNVKRFKTEEGMSPSHEPGYSELERLPYTFSDLQIRLQVKIFFVVFTAANLILLLVLDASDILNGSQRLHTLPILQYVSVGLYLCSYASFYYDLRIADVRWEDWDFRRHKVNLKRLATDAVQSVSLEDLDEEEDVVEPTEPPRSICNPMPVVRVCGIGMGYASGPSEPPPMSGKL